MSREKSKRMKPQIRTDAVPRIKYGAGSAKLVPARFKQGAGIYFLNTGFPFSRE